MRKTKVIHVLKSQIYSGAEKVVITIIQRTKEICDSVYISPSGIIDEYLREEAIQHYVIERMRYSELREAIKVLRPDVIHAHDYSASLICSLIKTDIPIIFHLHNNPPWIRNVNLRSIAFFAACKKCTIILSVSDAVMKEYVFGKKLVKKTKVVGNPIDVTSLQRNKRKIECKYEVAFLGRFTAPKNPVAFVQIIGLLKESFPSVSAVMIGDGELLNEVKGRIKELGLEKNITILGFQKEPLVFLNQAKVLCMPSKWEGFGLAAVEALSLGKPVVCSSAGGLPQIITSSCGTICETDKEYSEAIRRYLIDDDLYDKTSQAAEIRAQDMDNINEYSLSIETIYRELTV